MTRRGFFGLLIAALLGRKALAARRVVPHLSGETGIRIRYMRDANGGTRLDVLYGFSRLPAMACVVVG